MTLRHVCTTSDPAADFSPRQLRLPLGRFHNGWSWAVFSPCRTYRYRLVRVWDPSQPSLAWVMLNPSTADQRRNDATVRRCINLARAWGYGGLDIANLYGLAAKNPQALQRHVDPVGPDNDEHLGAVCRQNDLTVLAWGANADTVRAHHVASMLCRLSAEHGRSLAVLGWTADGQPRHPLCVPASTLPNCFTPPRPDARTSRPYGEAADPHWIQLLRSAA